MHLVFILSSDFFVILAYLSGKLRGELQWRQRFSLPFYRFSCVSVAFMSRSFRMRYRDVPETKMAFQTLATFTDIVQSNKRLRNATVLRLLNAKTLPRACA